jgi:hypothetical protein
MRSASTCRFTLSNSCSFARNNSMTSFMSSFSDHCGYESIHRDFYWITLGERLLQGQRTKVHPRIFVRQCPE